MGRGGRGLQDRQPEEADAGGVVEGEEKDASCYVDPDELADDEDWEDDRWLEDDEDDGERSW